MKKILLLLFFLNTLYASAQIIPDNRAVDWSIAGYTGSFPQPATVLDVTAFGAVGDSVTDNTSFILSAIDSLHGSRGVIYFHPGKYLVALSIGLPDSVIIRGASSDSTWIIFNFNGTTGNGFNINGSIPGTFSNVIDHASCGSNYIIVDDASSFSNGCFAEMLENNGSWDTQPVSWADNSVGQMLNITSVSGDTLFLNSTLRINYDSSLVPRIRLIQPAKEVGIECLQISRVDTAPSVNYNIYFNYAANCWVRGVESSESVGSHIEIDASTNITITGCYIHHSFLYDGVATHGYGITLFNHSGECLITNNIMRHLRHSFSLQTGANGNVISYNYSIDPNRSEVPANYGADISLHGHFPYANLFEGNIVQNINIDQTHGPSGPFNTFFRNRVELYGLIMTSGSVESDSQNFVGNEIPNTSPFMGNYLLYGSGHLEYANNVRGTITPAGATSLNDTSYYLASPPPFWQGIYPSIGMPNALSSGSIPARDRYLSGMYLAACSDSIILSANNISQQSFAVYPNPATGIIHIETEAGSTGKFTLRDPQGRILYSDKIEGGMATIDLSPLIKRGIYFLEINSASRHETRKIVVMR